MVPCSASQRGPLHIEPLIPSLPATKLPHHTRPPSQTHRFPGTRPNALLEHFQIHLVLLNRLRRHPHLPVIFTPNSTTIHFDIFLLHPNIPLPSKHTSESVSTSTTHSTDFATAVYLLTLLCLAHLPLLLFRLLLPLPLILQSTRPAKPSLSSITQHSSMAIYASRSSRVGQDS